MPLALQALNTHVANVPLIRLGSPAPGVLPGIINLNAGDLARDLRVYSTPAARQQLLYYLQIEGQNGNGAISLNNTEHQNFITALRALGYPQTCRNVALSHASECANLNGLIPGTEIIRFEGNYNTGFLSELLITPWYGLNRLLVRSTGYLQFQLMLLPGRNSIQ